jgi:hypothetical protein
VDSAANLPCDGVGATPKQHCVQMQGTALLSVFQQWLEDGQFLRRTHWQTIPLLKTKAQRQCLSVGGKGAKQRAAKVNRDQNYGCHRPSMRANREQ